MLRRYGAIRQLRSALQMVDHVRVPVLAYVLAGMLLLSGMAPAMARDGRGMGAADVTAGQEIDLPWLRAEVEKILEGNRVDIMRRGQPVTYHAPALTAGPSGSWPRRILKDLRAPWELGYPHQWFWDSAAHAVALSHIDPLLAQEEIRSLLLAQDPDGFIPHMVLDQRRTHWVDRLLQVLYWRRDSSRYLQPPVLAEAVEAIQRRQPDEAFLKEVLPGLEAYYLYLERARSSSGDGLLEIIHSYEGGRDRAREYDEVYSWANTGPVWRGPMTWATWRYGFLRWDTKKIQESNHFRVKDVLFNTVYAQNLAALGRLFALAGDADKAAGFAQKGVAVEASILSKMYDVESGLFFSLDARQGRDQPLKSSSSASLLPLMLDTVPEGYVERLVREQLLNPEEFWSYYPVPSEPGTVAQNKEDEGIIWRGPQTWVYINWFLARGLRKQADRFPRHRQEYRAIADDITYKTYALVRSQGFREYYDSQTGLGQRNRNFGWSTLVLDMVEE